MENVSEIASTVSTIIFEDYYDNGTDYVTDETSPVRPSRSVNVNGLLWPTLFTSLIIVTNALSLLAFCIEKRLRTYNNYFIINLSILDLLVGLFLTITVAHTHIGYFPFSQEVCKITTGIRNGCLNASNFAVIVICVDRHRATYDPLNHFMSRSKSRAVISNSLAWLASFTFWLIYATVVEFLVDHDTGRHCQRWYSKNTFAYIVPIIMLFYLPFFVIAVLYIRIVAKIQATIGGRSVERKFAMKDVNSGKTTVEFPQDEMSSAVSNATINIDLSSDDMGNETKFENENAANNKKTAVKPLKRESAREMKRATKTLLFIVIAFVVSWLPQSIISLIYSIEPTLIVPSLPRPGRLFFGWMTYLNSLLNPISYAVTQPLLRSTILNLFLCRRK